MDNRNLKLHAPRTCAAFDRWMETAGFPEWKIGGEQFEHFFDGKEWPETETKIDMLGWVVDDVLRMVEEDFRRAVADGEWTPAAEKRKRRIVRGGNELRQRINQQNRLGIWH